MVRRGRSIPKAKLLKRRLFMNCGLCYYFKYSLKRSPSTESPTRKCNVIGKFVLYQQTICDQFKPDNHFWCERYRYSLTVAECVNRRKNKIHTKCTSTCRQYSTNVELSKIIHFYNLKKAKENHKNTQEEVCLDLQVKG